MRTIARVLVTAFSFWVTTLVVGGPGPNGIWVEAYGERGVTSLTEATSEVDGDNELAAYLLTLIFVAAIFGLVDGTLGKIVRVVSLPLRILTLGLFSLVINGVMLVVVAWLSEQLGFGLHVDGLGWGILAAIVLSILASVLNGMLGTSKKRDRA